MKAIESVVIVGSSATGKSTLVDSLRKPEYDDRVVIPNRYITRPPRLNDNTSENTHISHAQFQDGVERGVIVPYWMRPMGESRRERYGFNIVADNDDRLRIYSANNAFLRHPNDSTRSVLETGLVVVVAAQTAVRDRRLNERSPDMGEAERALRLDDDGADIPDTHDRVEIINTTGMTPIQGQVAFEGLIGQILHA